MDSALHSNADEVISSPVTNTQFLFGATSLLIQETGSVTTTAVLDNAVESGGIGNAVTNLGSIATGGAAAFGVFNFGSDFDILNAGVIRTAGSNSMGVFSVGSNSTIVNTGTIQTRGDNTSGVLNFGNDTTVSNGGIIRTHGVGAAAIDSDAANVTILNAGQIVSDRSDVIRINAGSTDNLVILDAPGYLAGTITFSAPTALNIATGASHSVLWQLPTSNVDGGKANVSGSVPWFYDGATGEFATFDPTGVTAGFNQFADTANTSARLGRGGLAQVRRGGHPADASAALSFKNGRARPVEGFAALLGGKPAPVVGYGPAAGDVWITGFAGTGNYDGDDTTLNQRIDQAGGALGYAWQRTPDTRLGAMAGYLNGTITAASRWADAQDIKSSGVFAGVYGDRRFGPLTAGLGIAAGWQRNESRRFVNDNTVQSGGLTLGESWAVASYDSWFFTPEATLSADLAIKGGGLVITPTLRGRYGLQHSGGFEESGSNANASVDAHTFGVMETDFELAVAGKIGPATLTGRAGYMLRSSIGDDDVLVTLVGVSKPVGLGTTGRSAALLGAALNLNLGRRASLNLDAQGTYSGQFDGWQGMGRFLVRF